jgi:hypothetical protein
MKLDNDPEIDPKYLGTISQDFVIVAETLKEASYQIRKRGFSDYPIFPISKTHSPFGQLLISREDAATSWFYNATYVDEFVNRKIIAEDKVELFRESYKDPDEYCCLFVVDGEFNGFLYLPYPED